MFPSLFSGFYIESFHREVCEIAKHKCIPFPLTDKRCTFPFYLVHIYVWGPSILNVSIRNVPGTQWFVTCIDDCTRVTWIFLLKHKSVLSTIFHQFGLIIKRPRSDNGNECFNHITTSFCQKEGIIHESSYVKTRQQNGIAEKKKWPSFRPNSCLVIPKESSKVFSGRGCSHSNISYLSVTL